MLSRDLPGKLRLGCAPAVPALVREAGKGPARLKPGDGHPTMVLGVSFPRLRVPQDFEEGVQGKLARNTSRRPPVRNSGGRTVSDLVFIAPSVQPQLLVVLNAPSTRVGSVIKDRERAGWSLAAIGRLRVVGERIRVLEADSLAASRKPSRA